MFSLQIDTARIWRAGQQQVLLTAQGLAARGHRVVVVAHPEGELRRRLPADLEVVPFAPRNEVDLPAAWQLSRVIRDLQPDVVHAHDSHGVAAAATALSIGSPPRRPALVASRRVDFHLNANAFSRWKYKQVVRYVAASEAIRAMLVEDGVAPGRIVTVHDGIDVDRVAAVGPLNLREEFWFPAHSLIVGHVGALSPSKGQKFLVDAAAIVVREMPEARFLLIGEGELHDALAHQIKHLHLAQHVVLTGFRADVLGVMKGLDLFVMSSVTEGLGTALLDAMAAGQPIVATRAGGIPEVVVHGETGLLVPPRDAPALAAGILEMLRDPDRRWRFASAGLARVRDRFSVDRMVEETLAVYARLVGTSPVEDIENPATAD